ncbi:tRNA (adenosine(37)-N6)-threonylcarbamoyltransferase complex ATPase subunit type 1 TsaE [Zunongwangia sp.]|uniref:tRNA (adenosine(37)-N6)-threonylcarbamoyltransferase complex ATPase subunit type 1 TsaE n=1 Tax=Zunongwangia sp. TaxID=1965325 RepID=UPI003AA9A5C9
MEITYELSEIEKAAKFILENSKSKILLFYGDMGTGKTTLIKSLVATLGIQDRVSSPTFALVNEYSSKEIKVFHFDFYRLEDEMEAYDIGFEDYINTPAYKFIEWPEKIPNLIPENYQKIDISKKDETTRLLKLS